LCHASLFGYVIRFMEVGIAKEPLGQVDQMTPLEGGAKFRVLQTSAEDRADHLVSIFHFKTIREGALIHDTITQDIRRARMFLAGA
jgi:hypothetical protein